MDDEREQQRQKRAVPILQQFKAWLDVQIHAVLPRSALGNTVQYTLKKRGMQPFALGRKNFLFVGSERGGLRLVGIYTDAYNSYAGADLGPATFKHASG